jgi:hypothetical protein
MKNWKSGSLLLACALGLTGCGGDKATTTDAATDAAADSATIMDATMDSAVVTDTRAIRLVVAPYGYPPNGMVPQAFDVCVRPGGTTTRVLATVNSMNPPTGKKSLPIGTITQHVFPAAQLEQICGFPANPLPCVAEVYKQEDVTFSLQVGVPICVLGDAGVAPVATVDLTATSFTGGNAFTVAFVGDATQPATARAPKVVVLADERVATDGTKARVRIVNLDPDATYQTGYEVCTDNMLAPAGQETLLGDTSSVALQLGTASAYVNINPLSAMPDGDGGTAAVLFSAHVPNLAGLTHCDPIPQAGGFPITLWPPTGSGFEALYTQYQAGVSMGGAMPLTSFAAGQVATVYILRLSPSSPVAVPVLDSQIVP